MENETVLSVNEITKKMQEKHQYITEEFLTDLIQQEFEPVSDENRIKVIEFSLEPAVGKGENYSSDLIRIKAKYLKGSEKAIKFAVYVLKEDLKKTGRDEILDDYADVYLREILSHRDVLPAMSKLLQSVDDNTQLSPKCFKVDTTSVPRYFVFEDLKERKFKNMDKRIGLDFDHMELVMRKLAKYHASGAHLAEINRNLIKPYITVNLKPEVAHYHALFSNSMKSCAEEVSTWPGFEKQAEKLHKLVSHTIDKGCAVQILDESEFNVINHSDLWVNNIMFHYNENNKPDDVIFVDLSGGMYGSPGLDLNYFFTTSGTESTTDVDWDHLMQIYHEELVSCLKKLKYEKKIPSLIDIQRAFLKKSFIGILFTTFLIVIRLIEDPKDANLGRFLTDAPEDLEYRKRVFSVPRYRFLIEKMILYWDRKGVLDCE